jgi:Na+-transporting methylmalonyl-CoA/oxaloacetate decarboxylase gamma subunit
MAGTVLSVVLLVAGVVVMLVLHILIVVWALRRGAVLLRSAAPRDEERANKAAAEGLSAEELGGRPVPCAAGLRARVPRAVRGLVAAQEPRVPHLPRRGRRHPPS